MKKTLRLKTGTAAIGSPDLLNDKRAAAFLYTTPRTLRLWRHTRGLPHIKLTNKVILYRRDDLDEWLARSRTVIG